MKYDKIYSCVVKNAPGYDVFYRGNTYRAIRMYNVNNLFNYWVYDDKYNIWKCFSANQFNNIFVILDDELNDETSEEKINSIVVNPNR